MRPLVVIPARGGSKGIPGKNIKKLLGKPLIYYTIEAARQVFSDSQIIVSTDDIIIKETVENLGLQVPFLRPVELATDNSSTLEVIMHAINFAETNHYFPDTLILLQPTSPLRSNIHIEEALKLFNEEIELVVSVKEAKSNPYFVLFEENKQGYLEKFVKNKFTRRQDCPKVWEYNGAIYIFNIKELKKRKDLNFDKIVKYEMDESCSVDIDTEIDWLVAECILKR